MRSHTDAARDVRAVIGGEGEEHGALQALVARLGLEARVTLTGALKEHELVDHLARCRAVCFPPVAEDYGFVTVEAFASRKPVITCTDSGGPTELVVHGERGYVCSPTPQSLGEALGRVIDDPAHVQRMGDAAHDFVSTLTWPDTVRRLTALD